MLAKWQVSVLGGDNARTWLKTDSTAFAIITKGADSVYRWKVVSREIEESYVGKSLTLLGAKRAATLVFNRL